MGISDDCFSEKFNELVLEWARLRFMEELCSDFDKVKNFDGPWCREVLSVLRRQPSQHLPLLAEVLPLGVFSQDPTALGRRDELPTNEREAVETFRADYDRQCREHFTEHVKWVSRRYDKRIGEQFKVSSRKGKQMLREIASEWNWEATGGAPGEWGLFQLRGQFRTMVSLNLRRDMFLSYDIGIFDTVCSRSIRFHDDFLSVLGVGRVEWEVLSVDEFPNKLLKASEFAWWHVQEYDKLLETLDRES